MSHTIHKKKKIHFYFHSCSSVHACIHKIGCRHEKCYAKFAFYLNWMPILRGSQKTLLLCAPTPPPPRCRTVGPNSKNPPKIRWKIVWLKDHSYALDCLTNFEYIWSKWNDRIRKLCESAENYFVKSPQMNLFLADFSHLKSLGPTTKVKLTYTHFAAWFACHIFRGQTHKAATNFLCLCLVEPRDLFGLNFNHSI